MLNKIINKFQKDTSGSVAMEAIYMGVFVCFFVGPTTYLLQNSKMGLDASWSQRTAARNEAINDNCSNFEVVLPPVNVTSPRYIGGTGALPKIATIIRCIKKDAEVGINNNQKFWKRMESEAQGQSFKAIIADVSNPSMIPAYEGASNTVHQNWSGGGRLNTLYTPSASDLISLSPVFTTSSKILVPTDDTFTFENNTYAAGHDKQIWADLPSKASARNLYSDVFPSK